MTVLMSDIGSRCRKERKNTKLLDELMGDRNYNEAKRSTNTEKMECRHETC